MIHVKVMCVIAHEGKILATKGFDDVKNMEFFRLIGGGVHFCEDSADALVREVREELETELENVTFLRIIENVFTYQGTPGHEIIFLYSADLARTELYEKTQIAIVDSPSHIATWVPVSDVISGKAQLFPTTDYSAYLP